jgi:hypothetical protein
VTLSEVYRPYEQTTNNYLEYYIHPNPRPTAPIKKPSMPPNFKSPLPCAAAPVNCEGSAVVGGGAADVPFAINVVVDGVIIGV